MRDLFRRISRLSADFPHVACADAGYDCRRLKTKVTQLTVIARSECDEAIQFFFTTSSSFLRFWIASLSLAMTILDEGS
jgi:hypothetical protein